MTVTSLAVALPVSSKYKMDDPVSSLDDPTASDSYEATWFVFDSVVL